MGIERDGETLETKAPRGRGPWWAGMLLALGLLALGSTGCTATVVSRPMVYGYVVADAGPVPANIDTYPYVYYRGRPAYWVDGYWYYRSSGQWVVFVDEPRDLYYTRRNMRSGAWVSARYGVRTGGPVVRTVPSRRGYVEASPTVRRAPVRVARPDDRVTRAPSRRYQPSPNVQPSKVNRSERRDSKPTRSASPSRKQRPSRGR